jgi:hypothetical protein
VCLWPGSAEKYFAIFSRISCRPWNIWEGGGHLTSARAALDCSISDAKGLSELKPSVSSAHTIYLSLSLRSWAMNLEATFGEKQHLEGWGRDNLHSDVPSLHSIINTGTFTSTPASTLFATCSTLAAYAT